MLPESLLLKYLKVKALSERGASGERETAKGIMLKMEAEHTGIRTQALRLERAQRKQNEAPQPSRAEREAPPGVWPKETADWTLRASQAQTGGNWENIFQYARAAVNGAYDFAETIANAAAGRNLAEELSISSRMTNTGYIAMSLKLPFAAYQKVLGLNSLQKAAFRQALHEKLDSHLDRLFGE